MSKSKFAEYWADLKQNHKDVYQAKLKQNRERIRSYRKRIYADPEKHAAYKAENRKVYKERFDRMREQAKKAAIAELAKKNKNSTE